MTVIHGGLVLDLWKLVRPAPGAASLGLRSYSDSARLLLTRKSSGDELEGRKYPCAHSLGFHVQCLRVDLMDGVVINGSSGCDVTQCAVLVPRCGGKCQSVPRFPRPDRTVLVLKVVNHALHMLSAYLCVVVMGVLLFGRLVCTCECRRPWRLQVLDPPGFGCTPPDVGAGNHTWVFYKSSLCS